VLGLLGEVSEEEAGTMEASIRPLLTSGSAAVRHNASQVLYNLLLVIL
jgi:hypothetical protein